jgi:hypothetical protein
LQWEACVFGDYRSALNDERDIHSGNKEKFLQHSLDAFSMLQKVIKFTRSLCLPFFGLLFFRRVVDVAGFARIGSKGDAALFGGHTTQAMKDKFGIPKNLPSLCGWLHLT